MMIVGKSGEPFSYIRHRRELPFDAYVHVLRSAVFAMAGLARIALVAIAQLDLNRPQFRIPRVMIGQD